MKTKLTPIAAAAAVAIAGAVAAPAFAQSAAAPAAAASAAQGNDVQTRRSHGHPGFPADRRSTRSATPSRTSK